MDQGAVIDEILIFLKWNGFYQKSRFAIFLMSLVVYGLHSISVVFIGKSVEHKCRELQSLNKTIDDVIYDLTLNASNVPYNVSYGQCHIDIVNGSDVIFTSSCRYGYEFDVSSSQSSFVSQSSALLAYIQMIELMPTNHRALVEKLNSFLWTLTMLVLCLIAYLTRTLYWNYTQLILSGFSIYVLFQWWITDESIRWLFAAKKYKQVEVLIYKIARINKVDPQKALDVMENNGYFSSELVELIETSENNITIPETDKEINKHADRQLLVFIKNRTLLRVTLITSFIWFVDSLAYEGLIMISPDLHDDFYLGFVLGCVTEFPATIFFCALINRIGRKKCIGIFHIVAGVSLVTSTVLLSTPLAALIPGHYWFSLVFSLLGRLALSTGFSSTLIYIPELFPTSVRNTGYAISSMGAYISTTISPYTRTVSRHVPWAPPIVFGVLCIIVPLVTMFLPETQGRELAQTVDDLDKGMQRKQPQTGQKP
ncbi:hypothetical protein Btru_066059 [Bulinus truncatus]|nr:hypothetical protein Btru_066059 [Bulinus truncatus]